MNGHESLRISCKLQPDQAYKVFHKFCEGHTLYYIMAHNMTKAYIYLCYIKAQVWREINSWVYLKTNATLIIEQ